MNVPICKYMNANATTNTEFIKTCRTSSQYLKLDTSIPYYKILITNKCFFFSIVDLINYLNSHDCSALHTYVSIAELCYRFSSTCSYVDLTV
jgi:hypothetical protein